MAHEAIFSEVQRMIRANPAFRGMSGRFNRTLFAWYTQSVATAVRRQLKPDDDSISLRRFLERVHEHPGLVSREHFVSLFAGSAPETQATAPRTWARYGGRRGQWKLKIRREVVTDHIRALGQPRFKRLEQWVDRFVAHTDPAGMVLPAPRLQDLRSCLRTLDRILGTYRLLLEGMSGSVRPTILDDWTEVFSFAWEPRNND